MCCLDKNPAYKFQCGGRDWGKGKALWEKGKALFKTFILVVTRFTIREGSGTPLQYSCLENPRDGGAWWADIYGVAQSRTRLKWLSSSRFTMTLHVLNLHVFLHLIFTDILWNVYYHLRLTDKDMVVSGLHDLSKVTQLVSGTVTI